MFQKIWKFIVEAWNRMFTSQNITQALNTPTALSPQMTEALTLWSLLYSNQAPWLNKEQGIKSLQLPAIISSELSRSITIEMDVEVTGSARAEYLDEQMEYVLPKMRQMVEYGNAKGGLWMKPYIKGARLYVDYIQADQGYPVSFDANGCMTSAIFADQRKQGVWYYTRLESHAMTDSGYIIKNMAFRTSSPNELGQATSLESVTAWADIQPEATITGIDKPLFGYYRYPLANNIDTSSPLGVACFMRAVGLIEDADRIYSNLVWEFESGKRALYVDELAFSKGEDGKPKMPDKRLYRTLQASANIGSNKEFFEAWSPEFREAAIKSGLNNILRQIEFACGMSYGVISDPQIEARTATEIKTTQQRFWSTVRDAQKSLEDALEGLLYAMDVYATIYNLAPAGVYVADYTWDDSIIADDAALRATDDAALANGTMSKLEWRMRTYQEDEEVAKEKLDLARGEAATRLADRLTLVRQ